MRCRSFLTSLLVVLTLVSTYRDERARAADEGFQRKLRIVEQYEKRMPKDTIAGETTTASVRPHKGVSSLHINGKPVFPMAMIPIGKFPKNVCGDFAAAGVHIYSQLISTRGGFVTKEVDWWMGPGSYDFDKVDRQILSTIEGDPQAYIFLRVSLDAPAWWLEANPDELTQYDHGKRVRGGRRYSLASEVWEESYERMLRDLIRHIESSAYAGHIIGYQPAGGISSEWYWIDFRKGLVDYSPPARKRFRTWLKEQYRGDVGTLRESWNDSDVTFETAQPPGKTARKRSEYLLFRDSRKARHVMDFQRFLTNVTVHHIIKTCRICKEETGGKKITGVFYGYSLDASIRGSLLWNCGFLGLKQVLDSPHVDFLCAPTNYRRRRGGDPGNFMSTYTASYILHNKLYWDEADIRTHLSSPDGRAVTLAHLSGSLPETLSMLERGFGYMLTKGNALWWFTLAGDHTFHQNEIMEDIARMQNAGEASVPDEKERIRDVAVLADEETYFHTRMVIRELAKPLLHDMYHLKLPTMGAPYDMYLLSDIADERMPDYKMYVFLNPFYLSDATRDAIKRKVRRNGAVSVWFYAPGFITEDGTFSEEAMRDLTGIRIRHKVEERELRLGITNFDHPVTSEVDKSDAFEPTDKLGPVFWADDPEAVVLGRLSPDGEGGMVVRDFGSWRSVYCAAPGIPTSVLRGLVRYAGGHVYSTTDDPFYANGSYIMIHTSTEGKKHIALPEPRDVYDVLQGHLIGRNLNSIDVELPASVTRIYRLAKPDPRRQHDFSAKNRPSVRLATCSTHQESDNPGDLEMIRCNS